jgi:hypothetical protein
MDVPIAETDCSSPLNIEYKAAHQAFSDRWKKTDESMCRHSMSFHLLHSLRNEFFASYVYLLEKVPLGRKRGPRPAVCRVMGPHSPIGCW